MAQTIALAASNPEPPTSHEQRSAACGAKILVIEDNREDVALIGRAFRQVLPTAQLQVLGNGEAAIDYLLGQGVYADRERHPMPDLILLDLQIPRKSGLEVLAWIWEQPSLKPIRVVVLTGSENSTEQQRVDELDAYYQLKPSNFDKLADFIEMICLRWLHTHWAEQQKTRALDQAC